MKLPKAKFSKKLAIIVASVAVVMSGTAVFAYNQNSSSKPTPVAIQAAPAEEAPKEVAEVKEEPVAAPVETPKPVAKAVVVETPASPTPEELKAAAKSALINSALSNGKTEGNGWGSAESQWICMEKFFIRDSVAPENYMAYVNKNYVVGDFDLAREGNQRYYFDGPGTCGILVYTR